MDNTNRTTLRNIVWLPQIFATGSERGAGKRRSPPAWKGRLTTMHGPLDSNPFRALFTIRANLHFLCPRILPDSGFVVRVQRVGAAPA